jgi:hypothetical protein
MVSFFLASSAAISKPMTTTPNPFISRIVHLLEQKGKLTVVHSIPEWIATYSGTLFSCSLGKCRDLIQSLCSDRGRRAVRPWCPAGVVVSGALTRETA